LIDRAYGANDHKLKRAVGDAILLSIFCFLVYLFLTRYVVLFLNGEPQLVFATGNEQAHFELVRAIVEGHTFVIDDFHPYPGGDVSFYQEHLYINKPPGFALLNVPLYALFRTLLPHLSTKPVPEFLTITSAALGAVSVGLTYLIASEIGASRWSAGFCTLTAGLGTILLVYATSLMNHIASVAFLLTTVWAGFRYRATLRPKFLMLAAFAMGYSILINYSAAVFLLPIGFYILRTVWRTRHMPQINLIIGGAVAVGALPLVILLFYNSRCFGSPFTTAYSYYQPPPSVQYESPIEAYTGGRLLQGLWGFLFSWGKGIFVYTPVLVCALAGFYFQIKSRRHVAETIVLAATALANILLFAPYRYWFGGHSIGPRHILPIIPLISVLMHSYFERLSNWGRRIITIAVFPSIIVHMMLAFLSNDTRALLQSWLEKEGYRLGNLYTEILPLFSSTKVDIWGHGIYQAYKLLLLAILLLVTFLLGRRWHNMSNE
jgi:hypothetical protein